MQRHDTKESFGPSVSVGFLTSYGIVSADLTSS